jgi:hypothetical protein
LHLFAGAAALLCHHWAYKARHNNNSKKLSAADLIMLHKTSNCQVAMTRSH